jgi:Ca2+-transporting ATPase
MTVAGTRGRRDERTFARGRGSVRSRWIVRTLVGELLGFAIPGTVGATAAALGAGPVLLATLVVVAGAGEGYVLGAAQAPVLVDVLPGLRGGEWRRATALGAVLAWALGMGASGVRDLPGAPPVALLILLAAVMGVAGLLALPVAQWRVLRGRLPRAGRWIPGTAGAWALAVLLCVAVVSIGIGPGTPLAAAIAIGLLGGAVMAATIAVLTGWLLVAMLAGRDAG